MSAPIPPARIGLDAAGPAPAPDEGRHPPAEAGAAFLRGCGLRPGPGEGPPAWAGRERFVLAEMDFGRGLNFLATWAAWRADPQRPRRLVHLGLAPNPPRREDLARALEGSGHEPGLVQALLTAWPPAAPGWHRLDLQDDSLGRVTLQLGFGEAEALARGLEAELDALDLDGFDPGRPGLLQALARRCRPGARAAAWSATGPVRDALAAAGFRVEHRPGLAGLPERLEAHFEPRHRPPAPPGGTQAPAGPREALVVGAGLAGCAAAWALAREGWAVTVVDAQGPAAGASGNPAGLMHASFSPDDGLHARALRAAALRMAGVARPWLAAGRVRGALDGFLRLEPRLDEAAARAAQARAGLPEALLRWRPGPEAVALSGLPLAAPGQAPPGAWWQAEGGWLAPAEVCAAFLADAATAARHAGGRAPRLLAARAGARFDALHAAGTSGALEPPGPGRSRTEVVGASPVDSVGGRAEAIGAATGAALPPAGWRLLDAEGQEIARASVLVLAAAGAVPGLIAASLGPEAAAALGPLGAVRGQLSAWPRPEGLPVPRRALSGAGYALPPLDGWLWTGATAQPDDPEPALREADHAHNRARLAALMGCTPEALGPLQAARGRVGWRATPPDRLPWVGALPQPAPAPGPAPRSLRHWPRRRDARQGLYLLGGLGSRGLAWSALAGELLAHWVTGAPCPVDARLRDALDPARAAFKAWARTPRPG